MAAHRSTPTTRRACRGGGPAQAAITADKLEFEHDQAEKEQRAKRGDRESWVCLKGCRSQASQTTGRRSGASAAQFDSP